MCFYLYIVLFYFVFDFYMFLYVLCCVEKLPEACQQCKCCSGERYVLDYIDPYRFCNVTTRMLCRLPSGSTSVFIHLGVACGGL